MDMYVCMYLWLFLLYFGNLLIVLEFRLIVLIFFAWIASGWAPNQNQFAEIHTCKWEIKLDKLCVSAN